jgi:hypothetical protein
MFIVLRSYVTQLKRVTQLEGTERACSQILPKPY